LKFVLKNKQELQRRAVSLELNYLKLLNGLYFDSLVSSELANPVRCIDTGSLLKTNQHWKVDIVRKVEFIW